MSKRTRIRKLQEAVDKRMPPRRPPCRWVEEGPVRAFEAWAAQQNRADDPVVIELATRYRAEMKKALSNQKMPYYPPPDFLPDEEIEMVRNIMWNVRDKFPELASARLQMWKMMYGEMFAGIPEDEENNRAMDEFFAAIRKRGAAGLTQAEPENRSGAVVRR